jgi:hypothetical protein
MIKPERLAEGVRRRVQESPYDVSAYWYKVSGDREGYARRLREEFREDPVVALVVREIRFDNPNAILTDLVEVISRNRMACEEAIPAKLRPAAKCAIVLLARTELAVPQASSPVILPEWFPVGGGTMVSTIVEDLTWTADAPLNGREARVDEVCARLFGLEGALLGRLKSVHVSDHQKGNALLELIRRHEGEKFGDILSSVEAFRLSVTTPSAFRPSLREGRSLVARLWDVVQRHHPEGLGGPAKALATALALTDALGSPWYESLASVLRRPSSGDSPGARRFARNILVTVATACQFITAAAHSDDYGLYPVPLVRSVSLDLRRSMDDAEAVLDSVDG